MDDNKVTSQDFGAIKARLEEISQIVANDDIPLDEALDLYEEAVALGMQVSDLLEVGVLSEADSSDQVADDASVSDDAPASSDATSPADASTSVQSDSSVS